MNILRTKVVFLGDPGVGKSSIINQLIKQYFPSSYQTTLGVEYNAYEMKIKDSNYSVQLNLIDVTGYSIFKDLVPSQIKDANFIVYVFDVTSKDSFESIKIWKETVKDNLQNKKCIEILVGNKTDLEKKTVIDETTFKGFAQRLGINYFMVSALLAKNIEEFFYFIASTFHSNYLTFVSKIKGFA